MLAEIFILRLEAQARTIRSNGSSSSDTRFVPIIPSFQPAAPNMQQIAAR
jgi:hypothetical protein